ncbi:MAG: hypothetical protein HC902_00975 [Calothrix sp. SM1_5_4]|nr:hypothetical protein [Calothrix sp. SM1_5_4]
MFMKSGQVGKITIEEIERVNDLFVAISHRLATSHPELLHLASEIEYGFEELIQIVAEKQKAKLPNNLNRTLNIDRVLRANIKFPQHKDFSGKDIDWYMEATKLLVKNLTGFLDDLKKVKDSP